MSGLIVNGQEYEISVDINRDHFVETAASEKRNVPVKTICIDQSDKVQIESYKTVDRICLVITEDGSVYQFRDVCHNYTKEQNKVSIESFSIRLETERNPSYASLEPDGWNGSNKYYIPKIEQLKSLIAIIEDVVLNRLVGDEVQVESNKFGNIQNKKFILLPKYYLPNEKHSKFIGIESTISKLLFDDQFLANDETLTAGGLKQFLIYQGIISRSLIFPTIHGGQYLTYFLFYYFNSKKIQEMNTITESIEQALHDVKERFVAHRVPSDPRTYVSFDKHYGWVLDVSEFLGKDEVEKKPKKNTRNVRFEFKDNKAEVKKKRKRSPAKKKQVVKLKKKLVEEPVNNQPGETSSIRSESVVSNSNETNATQTKENRNAQQVASESTGNTLC